MKRRHLRTLDEDIRQHIEMETQDNIDRGMAPNEARRAALIKFGNRAVVKEDTRAVWNPIWAEQLLQDLRYALRMLRRSPAFTAVVVATLALGIGLNTSAFSVLRAVLFRPLAYPDAQRLIWLSEHGKSNKEDFPILRNTFLKWREHAEFFEKVAAFTDETGTLVTNQGSENEQLTAIGGNFWTITGARPLMGRLFAPGESDVIVLSYDLFKKGFGGNPGIIGKIVSLDGRPVTVTGVLEEDFRLLPAAGGPRPRERQAFIAIPVNEPALAKSRDPQAVSPTAAVSVIARLKPNISMKQAQTEIRSMRSHDPSDEPFLPSAQLRAIPYQERVVGDIRPALLILQVAACLVLLIAVVNIANLLLARATTRQREIAIRVAVGSGRARVARQFLTESFVLAALGGAAGLGLAKAATVIAVRLGSATIPRLRETRIDGGVLIFTLAVSLFAAILFGFGPALSLWKAKLHDVLKEGARSASAGRGSLHIRATLGAGQLALAVLLLIASGLMIKSFWSMTARPPGFHPEKIVTMRIALAGAKYETKAAKESYFRELLQRIENAPNTDAAGFEAGAITMIGPGNVFQKRVGPVKFTSTSAEYLRATGMNLIKGRWMNNDEPNRVVIVNQTFAQSLFHEQEAIGQSIQVFNQPKKSTIVGVVSDLKRFALDQDTVPEVFIPYKQFPVLTNPHIAIRVTGNTIAEIGFLQSLISGIDRAAPISDVMTMEQALSDSIAPRRLNLFLLGSFAAVAFFLALIGIYGVISYAVTQRTQEIGVRLALGAERNQVIRMVVGQALRVSLTGVAVGFIAAIALMRFMAGLLYGVSPHDSSVFLVVALTLTTTALLASWGPALRASHVDPVTALRYE